MQPSCEARLLAYLRCMLGESGVDGMAAMPPQRFGGGSFREEKECRAAAAKMETTACALDRQYGGL